jgi:hypothetical protein
MFDRFAGLQADDCPFANLPEPRQGRWGEGLTAVDMAECRWLKPELVAQIEFLEKLNIDARKPFRRRTEFARFSELCTAVKAVRTLSAQSELTQMVEAIKQVLMLRGEGGEVSRLAAYPFVCRKASSRLSGLGCKLLS